MTTHEPGGRSAPLPDRDHEDLHPEGRHHDDPSPQVRVSGARQLLALLPRLLGYHPDHSVVLVLTETSTTPGAPSSPARVVMSCRLDVPTVQELPALSAQLAPVLRRAVDGTPGIRLMHAFGHDLDEGPDGRPRPDLVAALHLALLRLADEAGAHLHDLLLVRDEGRSLLPVVADGEPVHPVPGWTGSPDPRDVPATADLVLRGRGALRSRTELVSLVRRRDPEAGRATAVALAVQDVGGPPPDVNEGLTLLTACVLQGHRPTPAERARITRVLRRRWARDALLARWLPELFPAHDLEGPGQVGDLVRRLPVWRPEEAAPALDRLLALVPQVPLEECAPLLTVTAMMAWGSGEGSIANETCAFALEVDPGYVMAQLLDRALQHGLRPPRVHRSAGAASPGASPDRRPAA
ncbi:DUF4192 family protein [Serinicoccus sp. LYQ131]|uniref:DUF4192 family protein n=1 Tax=Serinicoccus sp. LYQ131 TaxID=3378797 RepID=UPI003851E660